MLCGYVFDEGKRTEMSCSLQVWDFIHSRCIATLKDHSQAVWGCCYHDRYSTLTTLFGRIFAKDVHELRINILHTITSTPTQGKIL